MGMSRRCKMLVVIWVIALWLGVCQAEPTGDDSLRGALEAINRRQRDLADPSLYYVEHFHPSRDTAGVRVMYPRQDEGDGQPEDIGYGYQKSRAPNTPGIFEAIPLPESELGTHDPGTETHYPEGQSLENIILDYIEDNMENSPGPEAQRYHYQNQNPAMKRSVFRERDINELPSSLQNLYTEGDNTNQYFENGEHHPVMPSSFRERLSPKHSKHLPTRNAQALVRNFGGLNRDTDNFPDNDDDPEEYLSVLNSVWEKYQDQNPENFDPEDLSESDIQQIMEYLNHKEERKRQYDNSYETGYDFFNSPLAWVKRNRQRLTDNPKHPTDQFLHALKFLNGNTDTLESMREEDVPDDERDEDVAKLLLDQQESNIYKQHRKRFWRGNTFPEEHHHTKRYPIAKRSSSYYTSPAALYHRDSTDRFNQRRKKNVKNHPTDGMTDPKVTKELNNIFSSSEAEVNQAHNSSENTQNNKSQETSKFLQTSNTESPSIKNQNTSKYDFEEIMPDNVLSMTVHTHRKRSGQKEETSVDSQHKPRKMSKKSVDWSNYFGIDRRRKKSISRPGNDEWLLDQYLKAYSISAKAIEDSSDEKNYKGSSEIDKKSSDDMDAKLRAMEDMIVDQALKYTGAHEGVTNSEEVQAVKDKVIAQLAAAYSLEKMRKALGEFKSSMAAQKDSSSSIHTTTNAPTDVPEQKDKRVAIKKEKAGTPPDTKLEKKENSDNTIPPLHPMGHLHQGNLNQEQSCPVMEDITRRCKEIANVAGDSSEGLVPLCNLHQVCYLCGSEMGVVPTGCDVTFVSEANNLCGDSPRCRYLVRRTISTMQSIRGDPSPFGCDWQNQPCLARYLAITMR